MRLLAFVAPGGEAAQRDLSRAVAEWNRGLDIRLRFLNIGLEEALLVLPPESPMAAAEGAIAREAPVVAVVHGRGPAALAAATAAAQAGIPVVRTAAGRREGPDGDGERAADRLGAALFAETGPDGAALAAEGLAAAPFEAAAVLRAVMRLQRES